MSEASKRKVKGSMDLLSSYEYYCPGIKGMLVLFVMLLAGSMLGNGVTALLSFIPGGDLGPYAVLISYPIMFIPAMLYASSKSRLVQAFDQEGEGGIALDRSNFGKLSGPLLSVMVVVATLATSVLTDPLSLILPDMPDWFRQAYENMVSGMPLWATLISVSVFAPFFEEWLCRGMILRGLLQRMKPAWAMIISALFFALIHMNPWQALPAFILGLLFAYVYYRTGSLKLTMLMHCANNTFASLIGNCPELKDVDSITQILVPWQFTTIFVASAFLLVVFLRILYRNVPVAAFKQGKQ